MLLSFTHVSPESKGRMNIYALLLPLEGLESGENLQ